MLHTYTYKRLTWIDLEAPTTDEVAKVMNDYRLHPLVAEELVNPTLKPKVDFYKDYIYVVLRFPFRKRNLHSYVAVDKEVDFVISKDFIITTHYDTVEPLHNFSKMFEVNSIVDKGGMGEHAGYVFYYMLKHIYKNMLSELDSIKTALGDAEELVFTGREKEMVRTISELSRELINFRQSARAHKDVLESFAIASKELFGENFSYYVSDLQSEYMKTYEVINNSRELVNDLRETNDSLLSTKQNETMKTLTIMAFITFPLSLITDIFSIPTEHTPIIGYLFDFEIILGIMVLFTIGMFFFFKYKKWL
ncbi:MAG: magnesium transporter CorA family protein [Candidatus Taylorbacteria bacterium]|nr:magnesium transporter CorA family protein [Candidatus Taylorbacteria bacterium]